MKGSKRFISGWSTPTAGASITTLVDVVVASITPALISAGLVYWHHFSICRRTNQNHLQSTAAASRFDLSIAVEAESYEPLNVACACHFKKMVKAPTSKDTIAKPAPENGAMGFTTVLLTTFTTVFLAELGDKTQLATLLLSAQSGQPWVVFLGAALALISSSLVGVLVGRWLAGILPPERLQKMAGVLMVGLGLWLGLQATQSLLIASQ